jgi:hypothetical protein
MDEWKPLVPGAEPHILQRDHGEFDLVGRCRLTQ